jgi:peptidoglycan/LPS O-acetylase OafA/YrhL
MRAVAVGAVLLDHVSTSDGFPGPLWLRHLLGNGAIGVDLFFVISGFLITLLLLRERDRDGSFSLRDFYKRRMLRILPAYVAYLVAVAVVGGLGAPSPSAADWAGLLTYTMNWHSTAPVGNWAVGLTWTLSLEEQFYLLWPLVLLRAGPRAGRLILLAYIIATPLLRILVAAVAGDMSSELAARSSFTRLDGIAVGCLLAILVFNGALGRWRPYGWRAAFIALGAVAVMALSVRLNALYPPYTLVFNNTVVPLMFAALLVVAIANSTSVVGRVLGSWLPSTIGTLSYSLYLWQGLFLVPTALLVVMGPLAMLQHWPLNLVLSFVAAIVSYVVIETPFLRAKERIRGAQPLRRVWLPSRHSGS